MVSVLIGQTHTHMIRNHYSQLYGQAKASRGAPYRLEISAPTGSVVTLAVGVVRKKLPIPGWGTLRLDPTSMVILPSLTVQQNNAASVAFNVPNDPKLMGLDVFFQGLCTSPGSFDGPESEILNGVVRGLASPMISLTAVHDAEETVCRPTSRCRRHVST